MHTIVWINLFIYKYRYLYGNGGYVRPDRTLGIVFNNKQKITAFSMIAIASVFDVIEFNSIELHFIIEYMKTFV